MKKATLIFAILSLSLNLFASNTSIYIKNDIYELKISQNESLIPIKMSVSSTNSLKMTDTAEEIIKHLYDKDFESEVPLQDHYQINLISSENIEHIKEEVLGHFLKAMDLEINVVQENQLKYEVSYLADEDSSEEDVSKGESTSTLNINFKRRLIVKGLSLEEVVEELNNFNGSNIFLTGRSDLEVLPKNHFLKRSIKSGPKNYLISKGFEIEEVNAVVPRYKIISTSN